MAETGTKGPDLGFLKQKAGPLPIGVWIVAALGLWYFYFRPKSSAANPAAAQSQTGYGTDPSGNTGYIDPSSGYVYGSAEDIAALQQQGLVAANTYAQQAANGSGTGSIPGSGGSTTPPAGGTSTPPAPSTTPVTRYGTVPGLKVTATTPSTVGLIWNQTTPPAKSFTVAAYQANGTRVGYSTVNVPDTTGNRGEFTVTGLKPKTAYKIDVWANGGKTAPPHTYVTATTK